MDDVSDSYNNVKEFIFNSSNDTNGTFDFNSLKELYSIEINSRRAFSKITDLVTLITTLEKRDVLNPENVKPLEYIFDALNLSSVILNQHKSLIHSTETNECRPEIVTGKNRSDQRMNQPSSPSEPYSASSALTTQTTTRQNAQNKLPFQVVSAVTSQIGYSWKGLGRYLDVKEGTLEKIAEDPSITTNEMRARLMLAEYEREVVPAELFSRLLKALELSKRKDLNEKVVKILLSDAGH